MLSTSPAAYELSWLAAHLPTADRLAQLLDGDPITALLGLVRQRAPVTIGFAQPSPELFANPELARQFAIAKAAAAKLQSTWNPALTDEEIQALHALVHLVTRPSLRILSGQVPGELVEWPEIHETRSVIGSRLPGIGRLDTAAREAVGTGWFIAPSVLVTNNHVLAQLCGIDVHRDVDWRVRLDETWPQQVERWRKDPQARPVWDPADSPGVTADVGRIVSFRDDGRSIGAPYGGQWRTSPEIFPLAARVTELSGKRWNCSGRLTFSGVIRWATEGRAPLG